METSDKDYGTLSQWPYDGPFEYKGRKFLLKIDHDSDHEPPWEDGDGQGIVSDWTSRDKAPGERVLSSDRHSKRYYDIAASTKKAREEGWDAPPYTGTKGERAARAVEANFEWMRRWCNNQWHYAVVWVTPLTEEGIGLGYAEQVLGGVYYDTDTKESADYFRDTVIEMADEAIHEQEKVERKDAERVANLKDAATRLSILIESTVVGAEAKQARRDDLTTLCSAAGIVLD